MTTLSSSGPAATITVFDDRPFFEKALLHGLRTGRITNEKLAAMAQEAPKGMVQIARYFGSEFLRPDLELARERMVNLISLHLEDASAGDLDDAVQLLCEHTLLSRSKAGSDMLKALIVMPQSTHFGMNERGIFSSRHIGALARWSLASFAEFKAERTQRLQAAQVIDAAMWWAGQFGMDADALQDAEPDGEAVIRTCLLVQASGGGQIPDWPQLEAIIRRLRKNGEHAVSAALRAPARLPAGLQSAVASLRDSVLSDLPRLLDTRMAIRLLLDQTPAFMGRYFWIEDGLSEIDRHERSRGSTWYRLTQGHADDATLLTLFLCVAAQMSPKVSLSERTAATLVRKLHKGGLQSELVQDFIETTAPLEQQADCSCLWEDFVSEATDTLLSQRDKRLTDALALIRRECNVKA